MPELLTGTLSGPGPFLRVLALVAALVLWGWVVRRVGDGALWARVVAFAPVGIALWLTVLPYLQEQDTVDDPLPVALATTPDRETGGEPEPSATSEPSNTEPVVTPGPKLEVWLVPDSDQTWTGGGPFLGDVRGRGNLNHDVPADLAVDGPWTVLVWCATFAVEVANATINPV